MASKVKLSKDETHWEEIEKANIPEDSSKAVSLTPFEITSSGCFVFRDESNQFILCEPQELSNSIKSEVTDYFKKVSHV